MITQLVNESDALYKRLDELYLSLYDKYDPDEFYLRMRVLNLSIRALKRQNRRMIKALGTNSFTLEKNNPRGAGRKPKAVKDRRVKVQLYVAADTASYINRVGPKMFSRMIDAKLSEFQQTDWTEL